MDCTDFTDNEWTAYQVGRADASAERWRVRAEIDERDGRDGSQCRRFAEEAEQERDRLLFILAKRKERAGA